MPATNKGYRKPRIPITGVLVCCACAASGQDTAAPPRRVMNSRRFMTDPLDIPAFGTRGRILAYGSMRMPCLHAGHSVLVSFDGTSVLQFFRHCPRDYDSRHEPTLTRLPRERPDVG